MSSWEEAGKVGINNLHSVIPRCHFNFTLPDIQGILARHTRPDSRPMVARMRCATVTPVSTASR